mmetsp:Transcript_23506/g.60072  ORF Transcript_23506/g.60072 Transcript_23506/m.60072 type:complete len:80 (-) Transcript_23506:184-423(-)
MTIGRLMGGAWLKKLMEAISPAAADEKIVCAVGRLHGRAGADRLGASMHRICHMAVCNRIGSAAQPVASVGKNRGASMI